MELKIYIWTKDILKNYNNGYIIIVESSVEKAREKATFLLTEYCLEWGIIIKDPEDIDVYHEYVYKKIIKPLSIEPKVYEIENFSLIIEGGE